MDTSPNLRTALNAIIVALLLLSACNTATPAAAPPTAVPPTVVLPTATPVPTVAPTATSTAAPTATTIPTHTPAPTPSPIPVSGVDLLSKNQAAMAAAKSWVMDMSIAMDIMGQSLDMTLHGIYQNPDKVYMTIELLGTKVDTVATSEKDWYTRISGSEVWVKASEDTVTSAYAAQLTPEEFAKSPAVEGEETLEGTPTYVVSYQLDMGKLVADDPNLSAMANPLKSEGTGKSWIGTEDYLTRKVEMDMTLVLRADQSTKFKYLVKGAVRDFGKPVEIPDPTPAYDQAILAVSDPVLDLAFAPGSKILAACDDDQQIYLWTTADFTAEPQLIKHPTHPGMKTGPLVLGTDFYALAFSPDGRTLAAGASGEVFLYSLAEVTTTPITLTVPSGANAGGDQVEALAYSPDGQTLVAGDPSGNLYLWSTSRPKAKPTVLEGHEAGIVDLAFTPDGKTLITGSNDGMILLWSMANAKAGAKPSAKLARHQDDFHALEVTPDGQYLLSVGFKDPVYAWSLQQPKNQPDSLIPRTDDATGKQPTLALAISRDGKTLATADTGGVVRLWRLSDPEQPFGILTTGSQYDLMSIEYSPDGRYLAAGSGDANVYVWTIPEE